MQIEWNESRTTIPIATDVHKTQIYVNLTRMTKSETTNTDQNITTLKLSNQRQSNTTEHDQNKIQLRKLHIQTNIHHKLHFNRQNSNNSISNRNQTLDWKKKREQTWKLHLI